MFCHIELSKEVSRKYPLAVGILQLFRFVVSTINADIA